MPDSKRDTPKPSFSSPASYSADWRALVRAQWPTESTALRDTEFDELASILEDAYAAELNAAHARGAEGSSSTPTAQIEARRRAMGSLGSASEMLDLLGRSAPTAKPQTVPSTRLRVRRSKLGIWRDAAFDAYRSATRSLLRAKTLAATSVLVLGLGLAAAISLYSLLSTVVLAELPYSEADRLGVIQVDALGQTGLRAISSSNVLDFRSGADTLVDLEVASFQKLTLGSEADATLVYVASVDAGLPAMLGVSPAMGRLFDAKTDLIEDGPGAVLLSHALWRDRYGSDPNILGRTLQLSERDVQVVGVLEPAESLWLRVNQPDNVMLWTARQPVRERGTILRQNSYVRLARGVTFDEAGAELQAIADRGRVIDNDLEGERPIFSIEPLSASLTNESRRPLVTLLAASGFVLLLACINVAGLLLARSMHRRGDWLVRSALGAGGGRLVAIGLAEGVLIAFFASSLGLALAWGAVSWVRAAGSVELPRLDQLAIDGDVLLFALAMAILTALLSGILPALQAHRCARLGELSGARRVMGTGTRGSGLLIAGQVALALVLLAGAGVLLRTFLELRSVSLGFATERTLTFDFALPRAVARDGARRMELNQAVLRGLQDLPEVENASLINLLPFAGRQNLASFSFPGDDLEFGSRTASFHRVFPDYFRTLSIPMVAGRDFESSDMENPNAAVIVSRSLAENSWGSSDPLTQSLLVEFATADGRTEVQPARVIGVVDDVREVDLHSHQLPQAYLAYGERSWAQDFVVSTVVPPRSLIPRIQRLLRETESGLILDDAQPMAELASEPLTQHRLAVALATTYSGLALLIASIGIYAAMAQRVVRKTDEIGLRIALGASRVEVVRWVLAKGVVHAWLGIAVGLAGSIALLRFLDGFAYGVDARDPATLVLTSLLLGLTSLLASWLPARQASRIDPMRALNSD